MRLIEHESTLRCQCCWWDHCRASLRDAVLKASAAADALQLVLRGRCAEDSAHYSPRCCSIHSLLAVASPHRTIRFLESEYKRFVAGGVSQRFLIRRLQELISQRQPAAQLRRSLCDRSRPPLARKGASAL